MANFFSVSSTQAVLINASGEAPATVYNTGATLYYSTASTVSTSDSSIASGAKKTFYSPNWVIAASGGTKVVVDNWVATPSATGRQPQRIVTWQPIAATSGTDTACSNGTAYVASIYVDQTFTATGVRYLIGSVGGTDKVITGLWNGDGELIANSATAGVTVGTAANDQAVDFTAPVIIPGGSRYFIGVCFNGTTAKFRSVPAFCGLGLACSGATQTFGTPANITAPTTFTADKAPVAALY